MDGELFPDVPKFVPAPRPATSWVGKMYEVATSAGYDFQPGEIGKYLKPVVDRFGAGEVLRVWSYWCANVALHAEGPQYINPRAFARRYGYWRHLASDAA
jgi:hypothetical protein